MLNTAGSRFDFGSVIFAVLDTCEHRRDAYSRAEAPERLLADAKEKLDEVQRGYEEAGGADSYWKRLEHEVLGTVMGRYIPRAVQQTELERNEFGIWRRGDLGARISFAFLALIIGEILVRFLPWVKLMWGPLGVVFLILGFMYPTLVRWRSQRRHAAFLNDLIVEGEAFQRNPKTQYLSESDYEELFTDPEKEAAPPSRETKAVAPPSVTTKS